MRGCVFLRYPDGYVEDTVELRGKIVREIRRLKPDLVVTWDPFRRGFNHRDHRLTGQAALDAIYPLARNPLGYPEHLEEGLEIHRVNEVLAGRDRPAGLLCGRQQLPGKEDGSAEQAQEPDRPGADRRSCASGCARSDGAGGQRSPATSWPRASAASPGADGRRRLRRVLARDRCQRGGLSCLSRRTCWACGS